MNAPRHRLRLRVLVVDDEPTVRRYFRRLLARLVESVEEASDGQEALERIKSAHSDERLDLVLSDLSMPHLNGIELARQLYALETKPPIVLVTAYDPPELEPLLTAGLVAGVLPKPTPLAILRAELERHLPDASGRASSDAAP
ncbi:MAG: response regulator [Myxococcota bacterium]